MNTLISIATPINNSNALAVLDRFDDAYGTYAKKEGPFENAHATRLALQWILNYIENVSAVQYDETIDDVCFKLQSVTHNEFTSIVMTDAVQELYEAFEVFGRPELVRNNIFNRMCARFASVTARKAA